MSTEKLCHWCGQPWNEEFIPFCSQEHFEEMENADVQKANQSTIKLWGKFINHQYAAWAALFELITGFKPPKMKEMTSIISGHKG
jgi:hypothetical protein